MASDLALLELTPHVPSPDAASSLTSETLNRDALDISDRTKKSHCFMALEGAQIIMDDETSSDELDCEEEFQDRVDAIRHGASAPYNPFEEQLPKLPAYHPSFMKVEQYCKELVQEAKTLLDRADGEDVRLMALQQKAIASYEIDYPPPQKIGLMGDSGVGKSSLINALLDTPDIAACGCTGAAMTCCTTEYYQAHASQRVPYMATIILYSSDAIRQVLEPHFAKYYHFNYGLKEECDQQTLDELNALSTTAFDVFHSLYADRAEFKDENTTRVFLQTATSKSDKHILQLLCDWAQEAIVKYGNAKGIIYQTGHSPDELAMKIERFVKPHSNILDDDDQPIPSLWPLVSLVKIGLRSPLLERGLILADLPGLSDVNKMRTDQTHKYIKRSKYGLLVAPIGRVQTDDLVHQRLGMMYRVFRDKKALVVTKIDDMSPRTKPSDLDASTDAAEQHERLMSAIRSVGLEKTRLGDMRKKANSKTKRDLTQQIRDLDLKRKIYGSLKREDLVIMRNKKVTTMMRKKYSSITADQSALTVFAVSNFDYEKHKEQEGYDVLEDIPLSICATGIPQLRRHLSSFPAKVRIDTLKSHSQGVVEDLVGSMHNWSTQSTTQRREELEKLVARPCNQFEQDIIEYTRELSSLLEKCVLKKSRDNHEAWTSNAVRLFDQWTQWHSLTFAAFCRNDGAYKTKAQPYVSWNAEMLRPVIKDLTAAWGLFDDEAEAAKENCLKNLIGLDDSINEILAVDAGDSSELMAPFIKSLSPKKIRLRRSLEIFSKAVEEASRSSMLNVTLDNENSEGYLLQAMVPIYERCVNVTGKSMHTTRSTLLKEAVSKGEPFNSIRPSIKQAIEKEIEQQQPRLLKSVEQIFGDIIADFGSLFHVEETPDPKHDELRAQIQNFVQRAHAKINGPIGRELAVAMTDTKGYRRGNSEDSTGTLAS